MQLMKNQYFGDVRDLFKYDLIEFICTNTPKKLHFHFVTLLTEDDNSNEGMKTSYNKSKAGFKNSELVSFLYKMRKYNRKVRTIKKYYDSRNIDNSIEDKSFNNTDRNKYFDLVLNQIKINSLIFFDPDNGLEVKHWTEKHIRFEEIKLFYESIDDSSIIMVYQHFPRVNRQKYVKHRSEELSKYFDNNLLYISDNSIVFFFITKSKNQLKILMKILCDYNLNYPKLISSSSENQFAPNDQNLFN